MSLITEVLIYLRSQYEAATGKAMVHDAGMRSSQAPFYFKDLQDNLFEPMSAETTAAYDSGDGNELNEKMRALRSSSAMTYNLLGNGNAEILSSALFVPGKYRITYEKQLKTIRCNPRKANLDAYLEGEKQLIFCEMKMTEWLFNAPGSLRESYLRKESYIHPEIYDAAMECLLTTQTGLRTYGSVMAQYDALQMFKHTLAVYNFAVENIDVIPHSIRLVNCVWHLPETAGLPEDAKKEYLAKEAREHAEFSAFYTSSKAMIDCFRHLGIDFDILLVTAKDFADQFVMPPAQRQYLARYFG